MYWITTHPCPKCGKVFSTYNETKEAKERIKTEHGCEPSNGWPDVFTAADNLYYTKIGLVKVYLSGRGKKDGPMEFYRKCYNCDYKVSEEAYLHLIKEKRKKKRELEPRSGKLGLWSEDERIRVPPLEDFNLESNL